MSSSTSTTSTDLALAAFDAILASNTSDMDALDILAASKGIHPAIQAAIQQTSAPSYDDSIDTPPSYKQQNKQQNKHIWFDDAAFICPRSPSPYQLKRTPSPYPHQSNLSGEKAPGHIKFCDEAICYGTQRPCRLQRTLTPPPRPARYQDGGRHEHQHQHKQPHHKNHHKHDNHHHHHHLPHLNLHLPHFNLQLRARLRQELTALRAAFKEYQQSTLHRWEEEAAVDEEVRRLFLEDEALWKDGRQVIW